MLKYEKKKRKEKKIKEKKRKEKKRKKQKVIVFQDLKYINCYFLCQVNNNKNNNKVIRKVPNYLK